MQVNMGGGGGGGGAEIIGYFHFKSPAPVLHCWIMMAFFRKRALQQRLFFPAGDVMLAQHRKMETNLSKLRINFPGFAHRHADAGL